MVFSPKNAPQKASTKHHHIDHTPTDHTSNVAAEGLPHITLNDFMEVLCALHFASLVTGPIDDNSGLMLVAPSGSLKSSLLMALGNLYSETCVCDSNWYYGKLIKQKALFYNRSRRSLIIPELSSIYAGDPRTGGRMEQMLQQMSGEGSQSTNSNKADRYEMRAQIFGAMTPEFEKKKEEAWEEGFRRRFLWAHIAMENDEILLDYLTAWRRAEIELSQPIIEPAQKRIPNMVTYHERQVIRKLLEPQKDFGPNHTRFVFLCRALAVLKWHYQRVKINRSAIDTIKRFSVCLSKEAALLVIPEEQTAIKFRAEEEKRAITKMSSERVPSGSKRTPSRKLRNAAVRRPRPKKRNGGLVQPAPQTNHGDQHNDSKSTTPSIIPERAVGDFSEVPAKQD
jgi:hypothetical protein